MNSNYIDAYYNRKNNEVIVWERDESGKRLTQRYPAPYYFYIKNPNGKFKSIYGDSLEKLEFPTRARFEEALLMHNERFESDIDPMTKVLMNNYYGRKVPKLNYTFLDIEVNYKTVVHNSNTLLKIRDKKTQGVTEIRASELREYRNLADYETYEESAKCWKDATISEYLYRGDIGWSTTMNPYAEINAVSLYHQWLNEYITIVLRPPNWIANGWGLERFPQELKDQSTLVLVDTESELLDLMLTLLADSDVISGWNSDFFDYPYIIQRIEKVLGKEHVKRISFDFAGQPTFKEIENFGEPVRTAFCSGRVHLDSMQMFKKFIPGGRESFALGAIADEELEDIPKLEYDGTLETLYVDDFVHFTRYNLRDVQVLVGLDKKFKLINQANEIAHITTVPLAKVLGTVTMVDIGIVNFAHNKNLIVKDKQTRPNITIEGGLVLIPKRGLHDWIGSVDINSLYPSTMRALNISPEKLVGQFTRDFLDWKEIRAKSDVEITFVVEKTRDEITLPANEWATILVANKWAVSAHGTVFDQGNGQGIIPGLLTYMYGERKKLQALKKEWTEKRIALEEAKADQTLINEAKGFEELYDTQQGAYKLFLNSLYGALINQWDKFFDHRLGASTTGTGRQITSHMMSKISEVLTGKYYETIRIEEYNKDDELEITYNNDCEQLVYGDTDSAYFKTCADNKEDAIEIADGIANIVNNSFPEFMVKNFMVNPDGGFDQLIKCGREVVANRGIFIAKKKYVLHVVNLDGNDIKPGSKKSIKAMGSEIKKSDTPKVIQKFLKAIITEILANDAAYSDIEKYVVEFRDDLRNETDLRDIGVTKACKNLTDYYEKFKIEKKLTPAEIKKRGKVTIPGHVRGAINYNECLLHFNDTSNPPVVSGGKVKTYYLKPNSFGFTSMSLPSDFIRFPLWFVDNFKIDLDIMEEKLIDLKVKNMFDAINWEVPTKQSQFANSIFEF